MRRLLFGLVLLIAASQAAAQLSIEITGAGTARTPIAIVAFPGEQNVGTSLTQIVRADLERSGLFRGLEIPPLVPQPIEHSPVNYGEWRSRLADALVVGSVGQNPDGRYEVRFRVYDVVKQAPLGAIAYLLLPIAPLPQVEFPTISVSASLPGASPDTMAATVATPLECTLGSIAGVTEITSSSSLGSTRITRSSLVCTITEAPRESCGLTERRRDSSQLRAR